MSFRTNFIEYENRFSNTMKLVWFPNTMKLVRKLIFEPKTWGSRIRFRTSRFTFELRFLNQNATPSVFFLRILFKTSNLIGQNYRKQLTLVVSSYSLSFVLDFYHIGGESFLSMVRTRVQENTIEMKCYGDEILFQYLIF